MALLSEEPESGIEKTAARRRFTKGDRRILVSCDEIEEIVFGNRHDPNKVFGRKKDRASRVLGDQGEWKSVDMEDDNESGRNHASSPIDSNNQPIRPLVRPPQLASDVNGSIGGEKGRAEHHTETSEELGKRVEGQQRAEEREMVRRAARRGVVFGLLVNPSETRQKCEAVMNGAVVEPSFAKGDWSIRWRE